MAAFFRLSDGQWVRIEPILPQTTRGIPREMIGEYYPALSMR